jgi:hypothetical protein
METRQQAMIYIHSECGRIGPFWWVNADARKLELNSS